MVGRHAASHREPQPWAAAEEGRAPVELAARSAVLEPQTGLETTQCELCDRTSGRKSGRFVDETPRREFIAGYIGEFCRTRSTAGHVGLR